MALTWDWKKDAGTVTEVRCGKEFTFRFWEGNALMIVLGEWEENGNEMYNMQWFFCDEQHAKNMLGLAKGKDNVFGDSIKKVVIYKDSCRQWKKLVKLFSEAFEDITIELKAKKGGE